MEYFLVLKAKEILTHATAWMGLEDIMLSGISQSSFEKCINHTYFVEQQGSPNLCKAFQRLLDAQ